MTHNISKAASSSRAKPVKRNKATLDLLNPSVLTALPEKELLEPVQRRTFRHSWEGAHPSSGYAAFISGIAARKEALRHL